MLYHIRQVINARLLPFIVSPQEKIKEVRTCTQLLKQVGNKFALNKVKKFTLKKLDVEAGSSYEFTDVLMIGGEKTVIGTPIVTGAKVIAKVEKHGRGPKIIVFKYKVRKKYRKKQGHRQAYTKLVIESIVA